MLLVSSLSSQPAYSSLPLEFFDQLPDSCPSCGYPTVIRPALTQLSCSNVRCPVKVSARIVAIFKKMGVLGIGQANAERMVATYDFTNPLDVLDYAKGSPQEGYYPVYEGSNMNLNIAVADGVRKFLAKPMTLSEYVTLAYLPGVQESASAVFSGFDTLEDAYEAIEQGGVAFIQNKLGIDPDTISLRAGQVYETLMEFKTDLLEMQDRVTFITNLGSMTTLRMCISDSAGAPFVSKRDFQNTVDAIVTPKGIRIEWKSSVTKNLDYLIHGGGRYTNKLAAAERYGIPVMTGQEFIDQLNQGGIL